MPKLRPPLTYRQSVVIVVAIALAVIITGVGIGAAIVTVIVAVVGVAGNHSGAGYQSRHIAATEGMRR